MHIGGGLANDVVCGEEPSAFGHGVSPLIAAPLTVLADAWVVEDPVLDTLLEEPPPLNAPARPAIRATTATTTTVTISVRRRD
jgi:hypothetical protein